MQQVSFMLRGGKQLWANELQDDKEEVRRDSETNHEDTVLHLHAYALVIRSPLTILISPKTLSVLRFSGLALLFAL